MEIAAIHEIYKNHPSVSTDTRNSPKGAIFFALKGENFNGNLFAEKALAQGCAYAVVDEWESGEPSDKRIIVVENVLATLQKLANFHRKTFKIPVIGITGTNGKTTTKELVSAILSKEFNVAYTQGNLNNHIGVPLTLLSINASHDIAVVEMGANHRGEIEALCEIAEPTIGLITNVGKAHIEGFGSFENVVKTKGELYDFIRKNGGKVFVNKDNSLLLALSEEMDRLLYGKSDSELFASGHITSENPFLEFEWCFFENSYRVKTHLVGEYNLDNALAAIAIGKYFGVKADYISATLEEYLPKNNRSQYEKTDKNELIIDAYNANPTSMRAALEHFVKIQTPLSKAVILGDMKELGCISHDEHQAILDFVLTQGFDKVYLVGTVFSSLTNEVATYATVESLGEELKKNPLTAHLVLLKGSHSVGLEKSLPLL
ncbi:MAG: UDP-N-acetylmuramoyl-tripeptide--D-alanyl-D-alanine ligase [Dysgonamonadaceae bacterium]|jgi:UDP-N-acetylmuramoyl-tripeptide--D-alanyl-D-alanine ligase|nr:UDP-N-acetylmuramoyl-tripeptide--D-alanyl-D-alanine ligase [Dysgonamonadaceae bacterium]